MLSSGLPDVLIVGGGLVALATALELRLRGATVTVLSRDRTEAAGYAAAGMLAPQAEGIGPGPMLDLCLASRALYPAWTHKLEQLTGEGSGYWPCGILRPVFADTTTPAPQQPSPSPSPARSPSLPPRTDCPATWLEGSALAAHQPDLGAEVRGGWWFPQDGQVDNRRGLLPLLSAAAAQLGVVWQEGAEVVQLQRRQGRVTAIASRNQTYQAGHYLLAAGAWTGGLLSASATRPRKGQMLSLRPPGGLQAEGAGQGEPGALGQVLFGDRIYIVPRRDGLVVLGATSEGVGFRPGNTAAGIHQLLQEAIRLYPPLAEYDLDETWWGFRPETPDECPVLGPSPLGNLSLATGHYRNGVLLAPITAQLLADWIVNQKTDPMLPAFRWDRLAG